MKQAPHLKFLTRARRTSQATVTPGTALPPRDLFADLPDVLTAYDAFSRADSARANHEAEHHRLNRAAEDAERIDYPAAVRAAIREGKDATLVVSEAPALAAQARAHGELAAEAKREVLALGATLGGAIADNAPAVYPTIENQLNAAAADIREALNDLRVSWATWAAAWKLRSALGWLRIYGGALPSYIAAVPLDAAVRTALDGLAARLDDLPQLQAEEQHVTEWRAEQDAAAAANQAAAQRSAAQVTKARRQATEHQAAAL